MKRAIVSLSLLIGVLLGTAGLMLSLYLGARDEAGANQLRVDDLTETVEENKRERANYQRENTEVTGRIAELEQSSEKQLPCAIAAKELILAARDKSDDETLRALVEMESKC
ncbi:hypothetical protein [Lentzea flava]|uniref:Uncharacterized protein n=1 Tax=Lentzea flava TaxID=103732 RepID=A0ABQ2UTE9_9PSEU|nr:hypothetical protein [Lentzea flava]MCP2201672.1 hypothetical protein [Lentzea flava]GGU52931.1 hypothetical protein GCM10010178_52110 [Lentzea flava]